MPNEGFDDADEVEALRLELKRLRTDAGLSQPQVSRAVGTTQPSVARWESPDPARVTVPTSEQIEKLLDAYGADDSSRERTRGLWHSVQEARFPSMASVLANSAKMQRRVAELEAAATEMRSYTPMVIPGALQVESYMRVIFTGADVGGDALEESVRVRLSRRELLADPSRTWTLITTEGALRWNLGGPHVMAAQCRYVSELDLPNVQVGVVTDGAPVTFVTTHGFECYIGDTSEAMVGTLLGTARVVADDARYRELTRLFERVRDVATFGEPARQVFADAADRYETMTRA